LLSLTINPEPGMYPGLITTILLLMLGAGANVYVVHLLRASEEGEVRGEIESIVSDYKAFLDRAEETYCAHEQQQQQQQQAQAPSSGPSSSIASGHPHVSVVTAYRNLQWQRIPVLLLVEGDVIALMGGDITPGRAHELTQVAVPPGPGQPQGGHLWRKSGLVERGEKIFLRRGAAGASSASSSTPAPVTNPPRSGAEAETETETEKETEKDAHLTFPLPPRPAVSAVPLNSDSPPTPLPTPAPTATTTPMAEQLPAYERHRSLAPDSSELLMLSGDIRCFLMRETPILHYCDTLLQRSRKDHESRRRSLSRLFPLLSRRTPTPLPGDP
jgi:hypothetical protein